MSTFKDIMDTIGGIEGEFDSYITNTKFQKSLSKSAQEGVLDFPVIVSDSLSVEDAGLVSKALEREFASFVLIVMTMNPYLSSHKTPNAQNYIKKFHQNVDVRADGTDLLNTVNSFMEAASAKLGIDYEQLSETSKHIAYHVYEGINSKGLNIEQMRFNYTVTEVADLHILNTSNMRKLGEVVVEASKSRPRTQKVKIEIDQKYTSKGGSKSSSRLQARDAKFIMPNDYKKANELVPTLIHIRIFPTNPVSNEQFEPIDFVLGVKATLHPVTSDEMIVNIVRGIRNENMVFNFIRWTTGEIKFFKDFLFTINDLKLDAVNTSTKTSSWWTMLKRRKALARIKNILLPDKMLPNATIIITQEEVDVIKEQYGYDITNPNLIFKLMSTYFLIAFVIVDPALQRVKFLFDGKSEFETLTYATLAREATTDDRQFKEMLNMLGRRI